MTRLVTCAATLTLFALSPVLGKDRPDTPRKKPRFTRSNEDGHYLRSLPRARDTHYASQLSRTFERPARVRRRVYRSQRIPDTTINGKPARFAARETAVKLGDDLIIRRMSFPNADVARAWAGARAVRDLTPDGKPRAPRIVSLKGKDALIVEGEGVRDSNTAAHALWQGWEHAPSRSKATDLFSVDLGNGQVMQSGKNPVLDLQFGQVLQMLDGFLPADETEATDVGHGQTQRLGPGAFRVRSADGALQELRTLPNGGIQIESGSPKGIEQARRLYDALAPKGHARPNEDRPTLAPQKGAVQALDRLGR